MPSLQSTILITAPPSEIWATLIDIPSHAQWNSVLENLSTTTPPSSNMDSHSNPSSPLALQLGTELTFDSRVADPKTASRTYVRITTFEPCKTLVWRGGALPWWLEWLVYGEHWFVLNEVPAEDEEGDEEEEGEGEVVGKGRVVTEVINGERIGALLGGLVPEGVQKRLLESLERFNGELKMRVEGMGKD
jgi:hypothetical protein